MGAPEAEEPRPEPRAAAILGHLLAVKKRQTTADEHFEPSKEMVALLENYGQKMPGDICAQLESSTDHWTKTQWREINVEQMDVQLRRFAKPYRRQFPWEKGSMKEK
ncbi:dynein axonemal heavy chain 11-like [Pithys albifrons albifrons]|uniref:dynein axonemal heavy chain 11-like n=1 Tax=Pithys albifrons albifrons TaxID=3385563 RepID=UPI003A5CBD18